MTLPNGESVTSTQRDCDGVLTHTLGRAVTLVTNLPASATYELYWPDIVGVVPVGDPVPNADQEQITALPLAFAAPADTFFDFAVIHLLTTATLGRLHELYPQRRFDARRFRPNIVVDTSTDQRGFVENDWVGRTLAIGDEVRLCVLVPCPRCVRTTLAQDDLLKDPGILWAVAQHNRVPVGDFGLAGCAGVYCEVARPGVIRRGDVCGLE
jgi:MOSC domain-containing protein